ncbi:NAD(+) diphosphatase [Desulfosediminicola flagellatus]|uniref:NAD(+) diphosphatase n=1 Tax=Desulfosediminicola flagellatus TaxID=2569541 RepID=UPI0010AC0056|nr:NAD(+) diphosphatase [Desulfosediminicola flagellatus]
MQDFLLSNSQFQLNCNQALPDNQPCFWFLLHKDSIYLFENGEQLHVPHFLEPPIAANTIAYTRCIGTFGKSACMVLELNTSPDTHLVPVSLRESHAHIGSDFWTIAGRASQILRWKNDHKHCGRCGTEMEEEHSELIRKCPQCGFFTYPRISPAVIMSVIKDDAILLGRSPRFPNGMFSVLAGFVEAGETLEEAVAREVKEEVDIDICDIQYIGSQPWPFPHSLMVAFTARYAGGEIQVDGREIEDANWFTPADLPRLPTKISIARKLIDLWLEEHDR